MAEGVVDGLEVVEVHESHAEGKVLTPAPLRFALQDLEDGAAVQEAGQRVVLGPLPQRLVCDQQLALQVYDAQARAQARLELVAVERLGEEVVRAGSECFELLVVDDEPSVLELLTEMLGSRDTG